VLRFGIEITNKGPAGQKIARFGKMLKEEVGTDILVSHPVIEKSSVMILYR
jgi:hypothetical protein